jgi:hypothetical protein
MKKLLIALAGFLSIKGIGQTSEPCCAVIGLNPARNNVYAMNKSTGQVFMYRVSPAEISSIKLNDGVWTNGSFTYVIDKDYGTNKYFVGPVNFTEQNTTGSTGIVRINYSEPCCAIINIDNVEPCCALVTAQNLRSGGLFQFNLPVEVSRSLKLNNYVYTDNLDNKPVVIVQSSYNATGSQLNSFVYPLSYQNEYAGGASYDLVRFAVQPASPDVAPNLGRLNTNFPENVEWGIDIYSNPQKKFLINRSVKGKQQFYDLGPGNYNFRLNTVMVEYVPIVKGMETRLKAGVLKINSDGNWNLYNETKTKFLTSGNKAKMLALPVGNYQLKMNGQFYPISITDGQTTVH